MPTAVLILIALVATVAIFFILVAWKMSGMILYPRVFAYDGVVDEEVRRGHFTQAWFDANVRLEEFVLHSEYGYDLHVAVWARDETVSFPDKRRRVAVLVHGFNYCLLGQIKYASLFHELGFDCVLYDHRNHGLSGRAPTTMGLYEARDLVIVCGWARERYGEDALLGTLGESMGAATVMLHAKEDKRLAFAIEDCGFSSFNALFRFLLPRRFRLPVFPVLPLMRLFFHLREGIELNRIRPADALQDCAHVPMLFIHGGADGLIPSRMMQACFCAKAGEKEAWLVPNAKHADSYRTDPEGYREHLAEFLRKYGII